MSCCPGPNHGKPFDPDAEAPCEADLRRFSEGYEDNEGWYDDAAFDRKDAASPGQGGLGKVAMIGVAALVAAGLLLFTL